MATHEDFMQQAIELSREGLADGQGGPFGAVIVKDGRVVGRGANATVRSNDPTAHGEIVAIRDACSNLGQFTLSGCTIYTSCEPCPMCLAAIYWARIDAVYFAATREDAADAGFDDALIYDEVAKTPAARKITHQQIKAPAAVDVFDEWLKLSSREEY